MGALEHAASAVAAIKIASRTTALAIEPVLISNYAPFPSRTIFPCRGLADY